MSVLNELKRRNVFRVAAAYVVVGWLLIEIATTLLSTFGAPGWVAQALIVVVALGFVPAVVFSWVYELTPEGLRKESEIVPGASVTRETGRKLDLITIAAVILGVGFVGLSRYFQPAPAADEPAPAVAAEDASVAVLPFVNMSGNQDNEYFSDGLTETLLHVLAQVPELKVAARTSSFAFKGQNQDVRDIANTLNVAHILEGSVQRSGNRVRVTAQLVRARDGFHVWSANYDRTLNDIFSIQDEIAAQVSGALTRSLLGGGSAAPMVSVDTESIAAYEAYLKALSLLAVGSYSSLAEAERELKHALSLDPGFDQAKSSLAFTYMRQRNTGMLGGEEAWRLAGALLDQVIADNPDDLEAQALALNNDIDYEVQFGDASAGRDGIPALQAILADGPGIIGARVQLARILATFNRLDEAEEHFRILLETDPLNTQLHWLHGEALFRNDRYDDARNAFERSAELEPDNPNTWASIAGVERKLGNAIGYVDNFRRAIELDPQDSELVSMLADFFYELDLVEQGDTYLQRAAAIAPTHPMTRVNRVRRAHATGDHAQALALARAMIADDVEDRHGSYVTAVMFLADLSVASGQAESGYLFLENNAPSVNDPKQTDAGLKYIIARPVVFPLWYAALPDGQAAEKVAAWEAGFRYIGFEPADAPFEFVDVHLLRGDTGAAVDLALTEIFTRPVTDFPHWEDWVGRKHMAPFVADARVGAALDRYAAETGRLRADLVEHLAGLPAD